MRFETFAMERWQSTYECQVDCNLSESGVHPLTFAELLDMTRLEPDDLLLDYIQSDGTPRLKETIASMYQDAASENVVVSTGGAEANYVAMWRLARPGDTVVVLEPAYGQTQGLARGLGAKVVSWELKEELGWQPEPGSAAELITPGVRLVVVTNPGNPTGSVLGDSARSELLAAVSKVGAWLLVDEVYSGAEVSDDAEAPATPSLWGNWERTIVTNSLSKAYGLPGLRLGWIVAPADLHEDLWSRKDYTTIAPSAVSDAAAERVLSADVRPRILARTRGIIRSNLPRLTGWLSDRPDLFSFRAPDAGAICYARYRADINSTQLAERLRKEKSVLVVPGDHFGMDHYVRLGFGSPAPLLEEALSRIADLLEEIAPSSAPSRLSAVG